MKDIFDPDPEHKEMEAALDETRSLTQRLKAAGDKLEKQISKVAKADRGVKERKDDEK